MPTPDDIKTILENHEKIQSILEELVQDLKGASNDKDPSKLVPALENAIEKFTELLLKMKLQLIFEELEGITKEVQDLEKELSTSPNNDMEEVDAFITK